MNTTTKKCHFYNDNERYVAQWARNLIAKGLVPEGVVSEKSIKEIQASDLQGYTQAHFFCGILGWPLALKLAGWPEDREVWTGSCPCQPFSVAGKQKGKDDDRHLWPAWFELIKQHRPATIFGEQVTGAITHGWFDEVAEGLEAEGYAVGAAIIPACGVGAPHKRDRLWFVGNTLESASKRNAGGILGTKTQERSEGQLDGNMPERFEHAGASSGAETMAYPLSTGLERQRQISSRISEKLNNAAVASVVMADSEMRRRRQRSEIAGRVSQEFRAEEEWRGSSDGGSFLADSPIRGDQLGSAQRDERRLQETFLRDGGYTHDWNTESGIRRVANGIPARSHKLRAYGNAIVPQLAARFIQAFLLAEQEL